MAEQLTDKPPVEQLSADAVSELLAVVDAPKPKKYIRPFADAGERLMDWLVNDENRFMFGLPQVDAMTRGVGRGELCYVIGKPHSGKTQVVLQAINNAGPSAKVLFFTPDEVDVLVLTKLIAINRGINVEDLEHKLKVQDPAAMRMVREVAGTTFKNLFFVDRPLTFEQMSKALREAEDVWGGEATCVVVDFLELLPGSGEYGNVIALSQQLKAWTKNENVSTICLHQNSRSGGERGKAAGMDGMRYGGESEAIYVLEVYRKRDGFDAANPKEYDEWERNQHTVTINVAKNKRPPSKVGEHDFNMNQSTGVILPLAAIPPTTGLTAVPEIEWDEEPF